jgi:hypothetical protein
MDQPLEMIWFDWKATDELVQFIEAVTATQPLCFRQVETGEDCYVLVFSEQPVSQQAAAAFYKQQERR